MNRRCVLARTLLLTPVALALPLIGVCDAQTDSTENWKILETNSSAEITAAEIFSLATTLFVDAEGGLWDTWDTSLALNHYALDIINSRREPIKNVRFTDIDYSNDSSGFICGEQGVLLQTKDWGRNWKQRHFENLDRLYFYGVRFANPLRGVLCGVSGDENVRVKGILYTTSDGGDTWQEVEDIPGTGFSSLTFDIPNRWFVIVALGALLTSDDLGKTWKYTRIPDGELIRSVLLDEKRGIAVGMQGRLISTRDGGASWQEGESPGEGNLLATFRYAPGHWYIAGGGGQVWETRDSGETWTRLNGPKNVYLNGVKRIGPRLFVWGAEGTIMTLKVGRR
ncbi:MAG: YCF48-related protein [Candidatus Zixiibacteriota bacterium]